MTKGKVTLLMSCGKELRLLSVMKVLMHSMIIFMARVHVFYLNK